MLSQHPRSTPFWVVLAGALSSRRSEVHNQNMVSPRKIGRAPMEVPRSGRDIGVLSVSLITVFLIWAGTHQIGLAHLAGGYRVVEWILAVSLLIAGGFLLASLLIPVDIRQRFDFWNFFAIGGLPMAVLAYGAYMHAVGEIRVLDKILGWADPYGHAAMGIIVGVAVAGAVQVRPPRPVVTEEQLSVLSVSNVES